MLKTVARNFARKINASKRWIQRVIKEEEGGKKKKKEKVCRPSFQTYHIPHITNLLPLRTVSPRSKMFESNFSHISPAKYDESEGTAIIRWKNERFSKRDPTNGGKVRKAFE